MKRWGHLENPGEDVTEPGTIKKQGLTVALLFGLTLGILTAGELLLRAAFHDRLPKPLTLEQMAFEPDPDYLVRLKPNLRRTRREILKDGEAIVTHWNTNGGPFRGPDVGEKTSTRIIVYGDSNILARFSDFEDTFPFRLQEELRQATGKSVEVMNAGVDGFGPDQSLLRFEKEVDRYQPDIVVLNVFADNDFSDIVRHRLFEFDASGALVKTRHPRSVDLCFRSAAERQSADCLALDDVRGRVQQFLSTLMITRATQKILRTVGLLRDPSTPAQIAQLLSGLDAEYSVYKESKPTRSSAFSAIYDYDVALPPERESSQTKVKLMRAILREAKQRTEAKNVKLLVLVEPSGRDLTTKIFPSYQDFAGFPGYKRTNLSMAVEMAARANNMDVVNLFDAFSKNDPDTLFLADGHWSNAGQRLAAHEAAAYIRLMFLTQ
jgi:hypothetical protein